MSENGTAVAIATPEARAALQEIEQMRQIGAVAVERERVKAALVRAIDGCEWGNVTGKSLSPARKQALAEVCYVTGANPYLHIDILGGRMYHNAAYFEELINQHPHFIGYTQRAITAESAEVLARHADEMDAEAKQLFRTSEEVKSDELRQRAVQLALEAASRRQDARELERLRIEYGIPDNATAAYETIIERYTPDAPLDAIRHGDIDGARFIQRITEANWVGPSRGNDPVGKAHPDRTARTRSLRRCAKKAFSVWIEPKMQQVEKFEREIEAEFRVITADEREARLAIGAGDAITTGMGEPEAASAERAQPLPVRDVTQQPVPATEPAEPGTLSASDWKRLSRQLSRALDVISITEPDQFFAWARDNELPENTKEWTQRDFDEAFAILDRAGA